MVMNLFAFKMDVKPLNCEEINNHFLIILEYPAKVPVNDAKLPSSTFSPASQVCFTWKVNK